MGCTISVYASGEVSFSQGPSHSTSCTLQGNPAHYSLRIAFQGRRNDAWRNRLLDHGKFYILDTVSDARYLFYVDNQGDPWLFANSDQLHSAHQAHRREVYGAVPRTTLVSWGGSHFADLYKRDYNTGKGPRVRIRSRLERIGADEELVTVPKPPTTEAVEPKGEPILPLMGIDVDALLKEIT
jgi:hypothetical protein